MRSKVFYLNHLPRHTEDTQKAWRKTQLKLAQIACIFRGLLTPRQEYDSPALKNQTGVSFIQEEDRGSHQAGKQTVFKPGLSNLPIN